MRLIYLFFVILLPTYAQYKSRVWERIPEHSVNFKVIDLSVSTPLKTWYQDKDGDEDFEIAVNDYLLASHDNKRSKIALDDAKKRLADLAGETNAKGYGVTVTKVVRKGSIDYAKVPDLNGVDLEEYRKKGSEYWKVTLSEEAKAAEVVAAHYGDSK